MRVFMGFLIENPNSDMQARNHWPKAELRNNNVEIVGSYNGRIVRCDNVKLVQGYRSQY